MKIVYLVNYFPPNTGAAANNVFKIAKFLTKFGHQILVLAPRNMGKVLNLNINDSKPLTESPNIDVIYSNSLVKYPLSFFLSHFENLIRFIIKKKQNFNPDLVLSQYHPFHYASVAGAHLAKKLKVPHVIRAHDILNLELDSNSLLKQFIFLSIYPPLFNSLKNCNSLFVPTSEMKSYLQKEKKLRNTEIKIHRNGVDTNLFYPDTKKDSLKNKFACETILCSIGALIEDYGTKNIVEALPDILKTHKETHVIFIGDGPYKNFIFDFVKKNDLSNQVHLLGVKPHKKIPFFINNSDIGIGRITKSKFVSYCIPSKCLEYMSCGIPIITTPISKDLIKDNDVGILINRDFSKKELVDKIIQLIEDKNLRKKLGETGLKKIQQNFRWENIMNEFNLDISKFELS